jgi:quercetin dioxygenase-like cupin family protein
MNEPFIVGARGQHPSAPSPESRGPFIRFPSSATDGRCAMGEVRLPPLTSGPNLHTHTREDELFYVLDGVLTVQIGDQLHDIESGGLAWGARGTPHAYANRGAEPLHIMIMWMPGGVEQLFLDMDAYLRSVSGTPDPEAIAALQARYGATGFAHKISIPTA